jgi:spoIIIJ-associated protein
VEWVEVAGKTIEEATEHALDQLGVAPGDAEVIVVSEPRPGLFGRLRGEARVRARVRPVGARPKRERNRRPSRGGQRRQAPQKGAVAQEASSGGTGGGANGSGGHAPAAGTGTSRSARRRRNRSRASAEARSAGADGSGAPAGAGNGLAASAVVPRSRGGDPPRSSEAKETEDMAEGMTLEEQGEAGRAFLAGLLSEYGMEASVAARVLDEDTVEIAATGDDLGLLVGPRGSTLSALQDLTRAVVQRQCPSRTDRILVDVAGYRERRSAALKRFSIQIAEEVLASGQERALEAMSPADRKAVHDAVNEMSGVATRSEGEDPHRYIVIAPAS